MSDYLKAAEKHREDVAGFLRDLVALPSPSGGEKAVSERIVLEMQKVGFDEAFTDAMGNAVGRIGDGATTIVMDSHIDTVGIGDPLAWTFDPFEGKVENDVIYGRGAGDDKGCLAAIVYGGKIMADRKLDGADVTVYVIGTVMEEDCDGLALGYALENTIPNPDCVVIGESTDLDIYRGHRGRMEIKVSITGRSAHASAPERGDNAIAHMAPLISEITALNDRLKPDDFLGKGTVAVTKVECETASLNAIPASCTIYLDRRLTAGETLESAVAEIEALPSAAEAQVSVLQYAEPSWTGLTLPIEKYYPTWLMEEDDPLVVAAAEAIETAIGRTPAISKWVFSTNGVSSAGRLGIPTVGFGPGTEIHAHTTEDQCPIDHLVKAAAGYAAMPKAIAEAGVKR
ncbi:MAG: YgeY family selenium metabolism-linked hydrolase [Actinobacteria bacterium]|nr:YgeY family selenium metabolism-linked hydrolase [Actinomycetota bacterium]